MIVPNRWTRNSRRWLAPAAIVAVVSVGGASRTSPDVPNSAPVTYTVNGRQYLAITVGNGGPQAATFPNLVPEIRNPPQPGAAIWVFALAGPSREN